MATPSTPMQSNPLLGSGDKYRLRDHTHRRETPLFTNATNLKTFGISCSPSDLVICNSSTSITRY